MRTPSFAPLSALALAGALAACGGTSTPRTAPTPSDASSRPAQGTGATTTISNADSRYSRFSSMRDLLTAVPGLQVQGSGEAYTLRVRGIQSFHANPEPLVVLDGMTIRTGSVSSTLNTIRPSDVLKVDVLKDTGSTAYYGQAGVNGVIVITTRKANP